MAEPASDGGGRRRWRWGRRCLLVLLLVGGGALPCVNLVLMVPAVKAKLERKLAPVAASPVTVGSVRYWPWSGVVLRDLGVAAGGRAPGATTIEEVVVEPDWSSLFSEVIEVRSLRVSRPRIAMDWKQVNPVVAAAAERAPDSPPLERAVQAPDTAVASAEQVATAGGGGGGSAAAGSSGAPEVARVARRLVLRRVEVLDGEAIVRFPGMGEPLVRASGIGVESDFSGRGDANGGLLEVGEIVLAGKGRIAEVSAHLGHEGGVLSAKDLAGEFGGGRLEGVLKVAPWAAGMPFEISGRVSGVEMGALFEKGVEGFELSGVLEGEGMLRGYGVAAETWQGQGSLRVGELGVGGGGTEVVLRPAEVSCQLQGGWLGLSRLYAHSDELALRASGGVVLDGRLAVNVRVYVDGAVAPSVARKLEVLGEGRPAGMGRLEGSHYAYRDVAVRGTLGNPALFLWKDRGAVRPGEFFQCFTPGGVPVEPFLAQ